MVPRLSSLLLVLFLIFQPDSGFPQEPKKNATLLLADSLYDAYQFEEALVKYKEVLKSYGRVDADQYKPISENYTSIALCFFEMDKYDSCILWFEKALDLQKKMGDLLIVSNTLHNIGMNYKLQGDFDKAIEYYEQTLDIDEQLGNKEEVAITYNNIGMIYRGWGKYDKAIDYFERSLSLKKDLEDKESIATTIGNLSLVYADWKKYDQALIYNKESIDILKSLSNNRELALKYNNHGRIFFLMNQFDSATIYFENALKLSMENKDKRIIALVYNNMGKNYQNMGMYQDALKTILRAFELYTELGIESERATVLGNLGKLYWILGDKNKAMIFLDSSTSVSARIKLASQLQKNYMFYSDIFSESKEFEKSLEYFKKSTAIKDSVFTEETLRQVSEFQAKYEKQKDQAHILALEKENLKETYQKNAFLFTGIGIIVIALFIIIYFHQRAIHIRTVSEQKIRQLEEEKKFMAAKLLVEGQEEERKRIATELHDGLGVLLSATKLQFSVIRDKSPENKDLIERATRMLEQASGDVRKISHNMMPGLLTRLGFYEAVEDLFEHIGDTEGLKAVCTITGSQERLPENKEIMLYRIVQEMVNNTLKHAKASKIELQVDVKPGIMDLVYIDDGIGYDINEKLESESIGLKSIQSRVSFLNGKIDIDTKPGAGVKYTIQLPVR